MHHFFYTILGIFALSNNKKHRNMDVAIKQKIDNLVQEISNISDLPTKMEAYNYMIRQADFCIYSLEEEQRQYENAGNY